MKNQTLKSIFLFCILHFAFLISSNAQIVYTNVNPDITMSCSGNCAYTYNLDLNGNGVTDFEIKAYGSHNFPFKIHTQAVSISAFNGNGVALTNNYPSAFAANNIISSTTLWGTAGSLRYYHSQNNMVSYQGNWTTTSDKYLALKIIVNNQTYYGWARLSVWVNAVTSDFTLKDYAFNSVPDQPILAGETVWQPLITSTQNITDYCAGSNASIAYIKYGSFNPSNIFTAELSNSSGSFANPVIIGSINSNSSGTINAIIPAGTLFGTQYRIRVTSTNPVGFPADNGTNLAINTSLPDSATISSSANPVCATANLSGIGTNASNTTYQWKLNGANILNATSPSYLASVSGNYSRVVTNGCGSVTSNVINQTINPVPVVVVTAAGSTEVCPGMTVTLNVNTGTGLSYQWLKNGVVITGATSFTYTANISENYSVKVTNSSGCTKTSTATQISIRKPPASVSNNGSLTFCEGDSTVLSTVNNPAFSYIWKKNNVNIPGATSYKYTAFAAGNYKVKVINPNGNCDSVSKVKKVLVDTAATVTLSASGPLSFCAGDSVILTANGTGTQYQWKKADLYITGATSQIYVAKTAGTYRCKVTNNCNSKTSAGITITIPCRMSDENISEALEHLSVYPNPSSQSTTISFSLSKSEKVSLKIFDVNGRLVSTLADKIFEEGEHQIEFNAEKQNGGIYFLKMQTGEFLKTEKLIITK